MVNLNSFKLAKSQMNCVRGGEINAHCTLSKNGVDTVVDIHTNMTDPNKLQDYVARTNEGYEVSNCRIN